MTTLYTYSEARQKFASLLEKAVQEGEVRIKRQDGQIFVLKPETKTKSPFDIEGVDLGITTAEILEAIRESRETA